jgi:hypothetical protein
MYTLTILQLCLGRVHIKTLSLLVYSLSPLLALNSKLYDYTLAVPNICQAELVLFDIERLISLCSKHNYSTLNVGTKQLTIYVQYICIYYVCTYISTYQYIYIHRSTSSTSMNVILYDIHIRIYIVRRYIAI